MNQSRWVVYTAPVFPLVLLVGLVWTRFSHPQTNAKVIGSAFDEAHPHNWPLPPVDSVRMHPEDTHRYALDTSHGAVQWRALVPSAAPNGTIYLGADARPFTVSMLHQLQCLDIIRTALVMEEEEDREEDTRLLVLTNHCMNYLRQVTLCHGHLALESVRSDQRPKITDLTRSTYVCRDWRVLYDALK
ncbi:hypothetical protein ACEPAH_3970 [Sanghuangporus vaninii]